MTFVLHYHHFSQNIPVWHRQHPGVSQQYVLSSIYPEANYLTLLEQCVLGQALWPCDAISNVVAFVTGILVAICARSQSEPVSQNLCWCCHLDKWLIGTSRRSGVGTVMGVSPIRKWPGVSGCRWSLSVSSIIVSGREFKKASIWHNNVLISS